MKKMLGKRFMFLVALLVSLCMPVMAETTVSKSFNSKTGNSYPSVEGTFDSYVSYSATKGSANWDPSAPGDYSKYLFLYSGNQLTITVSGEHTITQVVVTFTGKNESRRFGNKTVKTFINDAEVTYKGTPAGNDSETYTIPKISNGANKVTITGTNSARITKIEVTYEAKPVGGGDNEGGDVELVDEDSYILSGDGNTPFYIRNKATGLYVKYGGSYGMDAIEGRAAHPFKAYKNNDNTYSLGTIHGYFNSMYSQASLFMDRPKSESNWVIKAVAGESGVYNLLGENGRALASVGNIYGILEFRVEDADDIFQRWELVTENELLSEMGKATKANPVDITPVIKGAAFDYADVAEVKEGTPFAPEVRTTLGLPTPPTGEGYREPTYSYVNYWEGFMAFAHYAAMWSDDPLVDSNTNLNGIGLSRNNIRNERVIEQFIEIPLSAGTYTFSYQGFYDARTGAWGDLSLDEDEKPTMSIVAVNESDLSENTYTNTLKKYTDSSIKKLINSSASDKGYYVAGMLRDNRENDSYRDNIQFTLTENAIVGFRIHKPETSDKSGGSNCQWLVAFDDFTLVYQGNDNSTLDQAVLYYDRVKAAYLHATNKLYELAGKSYTNCTTVANNACVHWDKWDEAIGNVVIVNGISENSLRGETVTTPTNKFAYLNGTATSNKIDTEKEFLEALAKIEEAYQAALKEHNSHFTDKTDWIGNPSFQKDGFYTHSWTEGDATLEEVVIPHWNSIQCRWYWDGTTNNNYSGQDRNAIMEANGLNCHDTRYFNSWNGVHGKEAHPIQQSIHIEEAGLYELSALVSSYAKGEDAWDAGGAITDYTIFLTAGTYHSGIVAQGKDNFIEHKLLFLVEQDGTDVTIGAVGGDGDMYNYYDPRNGGFFRADNFRLTKVSDVSVGCVKLALDEVKKTRLDEYGAAALNLSDYENMVINNLVASESAAQTAISEMQAKMKTAVLAQKTKNADMTWAITNANFETGDLTGWNFTKTTNTWDTGVFPHDIAKASVGADGRYLFNTWDGTPSKCKEITQKISGLRNGTYKLSAMVASDSGNKMTIKAGTASGEVTCVGADKMVEVSCEFTITGGTSQEVTIGVYNNSTWYKADDFRLTFIGNTLSLCETQTKQDIQKNVKPDWYTDFELDRPIASGKWHSFIVPFDIEDIPENWDVRQLVNSTVDETGYHLYLEFSDPNNNPVTKIEANKPYMVRYYPNGIGNEDTTVKYYGTIASEHYLDLKDGWATPTAANPFTTSRVDTKVDVTNEAWGSVEFIGTYVNETSIPKNAFYVSNNKFYFTGDDDTKTMKGYRAYFKQTVQGNRALARSFGMRSGETSDIQSKNNVEVKVVGIYNANGMKLEEMQDGLNIVKMSDGSSVKILIK